MPIELPEADPCFFCEVVAGRQEKGIVEATGTTLTVVNGRQFEEGQVLVAPRRHAPTLLDLSDDEAAAVIAAARRVAAAMVRAYDPDGITLYQNNGVASLQEVPHFHMHVVPRRRANAAWGSGPPHIAVLEGRRPQPASHDARVSLEQERTVADHIKSHLQGGGGR